MQHRLAILASGQHLRFPAGDHHKCMIDGSMHCSNNKGSIAIQQAASIFIIRNNCKDIEYLSYQYHIILSMQLLSLCLCTNNQRVHTWYIIFSFWLDQTIGCCVAVPCYNHFLTSIPFNTPGKLTYPLKKALLKMMFLSPKVEYIHIYIYISYCYVVP